MKIFIYGKKKYSGEPSDIELNRPGNHTNIVVTDRTEKSMSQQKKYKK